MSGGDDIIDLEPEHIDAMIGLRQETENLHRDLHPRLFSGARPAERIRKHLGAFVDADRSDGRFAIGHVGDDGVQAYALGSWFEHDGDETMRTRRGVYVHDIAVRPDRRGKGLARALMDEIVRRAAARGLPAQVHAAVWHGNDHSHALFLAAGFQPLNTSYALYLDSDDGA